MLDRTIPYYNIICKCDRYCPVDAPLPLGLRIRTWQPGDEKAWARLAYAIGDFPSPEEAETYFVSHYLKQPKEAEKRCFFVVTEGNEVIASCIAWRDRKGAQTVASLHWLVVAPEQQGKKIGKALCRHVLEAYNDWGEFPVYLHTQPWSYVALLLYLRQGFQVQKTDTFAQYENQYTQAIDTLQSLLPPAQWQELLLHTDP